MHPQAHARVHPLHKIRVNKRGYGEVPTRAGNVQKCNDLSISSFTSSNQHCDPSWSETAPWNNEHAVIFPRLRHVLRCYASYQQPPACRTQAGLREARPTPCCQHRWRQWRLSHCPWLGSTLLPHKIKLEQMHPQAHARVHPLHKIRVNKRGYGEVPTRAGNVQKCNDLSISSFTSSNQHCDPSWSETAPWNNEHAVIFPRLRHVLRCYASYQQPPACRTQAGLRGARPTPCCQHQRRQWRRRHA